MTSSQIIRLTLPLLSLAMLSGCFGGDSGGGDDAQTGQINPHGIRGLSYTTASQSGLTDDQGRFKYYPGERLDLKVGNLTIAEGVPAQEFVTPLEFFPDIRERLDDAAVDDEGLQTHTITEQEMLTRTPLINLTRFLMSLNWADNTVSKEGIEIRDRVLEQLNAALAELNTPIDFNVSEADFAAGGADNLSPANQVLARICFYPEGDELCEAPPTQAEIDNAPPRPEDDDERDPDIEYQEDLETKRDRILNAVRSIGDVDVEDAEIYLTHELDAITTRIANRYYLNQQTAEYPPSDTDIKTVSILKVGDEPSLADIEAISTRDQDIVVHSFDWQSASVDYFVAGEAGGESEILINFQPDNTYRWIRKKLRVLIR